MRYQLFKLFNAMVGYIPAPIMGRMLSAMHRHPEYADRHKFTVYPQVFYSPFPEPSEVDFSKLEQKRDLPGVNFNLTESTKLLKELARYSSEIKEFLNNRPADTLKYWNMTYPVGDS